MFINIKQVQRQNNIFILVSTTKEGVKFNAMDVIWASSDPERV